MRRSIDTYIRSIVNDNALAIKESGMTVAEYIIKGIDNIESCIDFFDSREYEYNEISYPTAEQIEALKEYIKHNYDYINY